jgi:hypothetical protein
MIAGTDTCDVGDGWFGMTLVWGMRSCDDRIQSLDIQAQARANFRATDLIIGGQQETRVLVRDFIQSGSGHRYWYELVDSIYPLASTINVGLVVSSFLSIRCVRLWHIMTSSGRNKFIFNPGRLSLGLGEINW